MECVPAFEKFMTTVRFRILPPLNPRQSVDALYGRFPPHLRFNMDQCPLPFVVGQDHTFTNEEDTDVHIKCPSEALRKRQFTMHVVFNAGEGVHRAGWVDLVCKGTGKRIRAAEKALWDDRVDVFFQKHAWVDTDVMKDLAQKFVTFKTQRYGADTWVLLYCDNLRAHLANDVKKIFGDSKVFLCFLPPNMTHFVQPIDAGLDRSTRIAVGNDLDRWLMDADNMSKWEGKMVAGERRILITKLFGNAVDHVLLPENDKMRVSCFERTGCLITMLPLEEFDAKIRPQGMEVGSFVVPKTRALLDGEVEVQVTEGDNVGITEELAALAEETLNLEEAGGNEEILLENETTGSG